MSPVAGVVYEFLFDKRRISTRLIVGAFLLVWLTAWSAAIAGASTIAWSTAVATIAAVTAIAWAAAIAWATAVARRAAVAYARRFFYRYATVGHTCGVPRVALRRIDDSFLGRPKLRADAALYVAKTNGRNRVSLSFDELPGSSQSSDDLSAA